MNDSGDKLVRGIKWGVVAVICLPIVIGIIALVSWRSGLAREVNGKLQSIKAAGLPTNGEELNKWYAPVPDSANAALVMTQAFALMLNLDDERSNAIASFKMPPRSQPLSANEEQLLADYVRINEAAIAKVSEALALPQSRYPIDLGCGNYTLLPHLAKLRDLSRLEVYRALVAARAGHADQAALAVGDILGIAGTLDEEPVLISQLVRIASLSMARSCLERTLNAVSLDEAALRNLSSAFHAALRTNLMARALVGERAMHAPVFRMSWAEIKRLADLSPPDSSDAPERPLPGKSPWFLQASGFLERDLNFYLTVMQTNIDFALKPAPGNLQITNVSPQMEQEAVRMKYILSAMLLPALSRVVLRETDCGAQVRVAIAAIAVERFRLANQRLPASLEDLVPEFLTAVPRDPFTGQSLLYKQIPKGYVVYSVDRDGIDDGGKEKPANRKNSDRNTYDITFTVER